MLPTSTDVLIVGAGPTGLALAVALRQAGIDHLLIDRLAEGQNTSRAAVIHAHTLEVLEPLGVVGELIGRGLKIERFALRDRDRALLQLHFGKLPSAYDFMLMLPQDVTERVLADRLAALGGTVHRGVTATAVTQDAAGARVTVRSAAGEQVIPARYVVAGDGMHSLVREAAGIAFEGDANAESSSSPTSGCAGRSAATKSRCSSPRREWSSWRRCPTAASASSRPWRTRRKHPTPPTSPLSSTRAAPRAVRPWSRAVLWSSRFRIQHRVAASYRAGRLFLMGDAAHVHSPAGGQGMNTGLVDAVTLGGILADVVSGRRPEAWLDRYGALRRPAAERVMTLAGRLTTMAVTRSAPQRALRNAALSIMDALPPVKDRLAMNLSGLARRDLAA